MTNMKHQMLSFFGAGTLVASVTLGGIGTASAGGVLKSAVNDWTGGAVMCEIVHQIAEDTDIAFQH